MIGTAVFLAVRTAFGAALTAALRYLRKRRI